MGQNVAAPAGTQQLISPPKQSLMSSAVNTSMTQVGQSSGTEPLTLQSLSGMSRAWSPVSFLPVANMVST